MSNRQARLSRREKFKLVLKWMIVLSMAVVVIFVVMKGYQHVTETYTRHNREIAAARVGYLEQKCYGNAIIVHDEKTYFAPCEGYFENAVSEGEKIRAGCKTGTFICSNGKRLNITAPVTGIFTQHVDGLEKVFQGAKLEELSPEVFNYKYILNKTEHYYSGDPVFKIVNNIKPPEMLVRLHEYPPAKVVKGSNLIVRCGKTELGKARIQKVTQVNNDYYLYLSCEEYNQFLTDHRKINVTIVFDCEEGIIIPEKAIRSKDQKKGVYCIEGEKIHFKNIEILKIRNHMVLVKGLETNEMIILNADK